MHCARQNAPAGTIILVFGCCGFLPACISAMHGCGSSGQSIQTINSRSVAFSAPSRAATHGTGCRGRGARGTSASIAVRAVEREEKAACGTHLNLPYISANSAATVIAAPAASRRPTPSQDGTQACGGMEAMAFFSLPFSNAGLMLVSRRAGCRRSRGPVDTL